MSGPGESEAARQVASAYEWAAGLILLGRQLLDEGVDVDLAPVQPAVRDLCEAIRQLSGEQAKAWLPRLVGLQHELTQLGRDLAQRGRGMTPGTPEGEPR